MTAVSQIRHHLHRGDVLGVFLQIQKLAQKKVLRELDFIEIFFHEILFFILAQRCRETQSRLFVNTIFSGENRMTQRHSPHSLRLCAR